MKKKKKLPSMEMCYERLIKNWKQQSIMSTIVFKVFISNLITFFSMHKGDIGMPVLPLEANIRSPEWIFVLQIVLNKEYWNWFSRNIGI